MLLAKIEAQRLRYEDGDDFIRPGSRWRLKDATDPLLVRPVPDYGLVLMVSEVIVIDDEISTIVLHPHPMWKERHFRTGSSFSRRRQECHNHITHMSFSVFKKA